MGYLDNRTITVEAILTKKGRQLLSSGRQYLNITKFALADDEVDYHLWNTAHPSGSNYYGIAIEQMPVLEPSSDETQTMRYKLVSLDKSTPRIPVVQVPQTVIDFREGNVVDIYPQTTYSGGSINQTFKLNSTFGYTAILHNSDAADLSVIDAAPIAGSEINTVEAQIETLKRAILQDPDNQEKLTNQLNAAVAKQKLLADSLKLQGSRTGFYLGDTDAARSVYATGLQFRLTAKRVISDTNTILTIIGNETGGQTTISVTTRAYNVQ